MKIRIGFIGLGLIGGSIAKSIRRFYPSYEIIAFDIHRDTLSLALSEGIIDITCTSINEEYRSCDFIFLCTPVSYNTAYLHNIKDFIGPNTILTDVGSVKTPIHQKVKELGLTRNFIGGHPMTGSEKIGFSSSTDILLENSYYILTPTEDVPIQSIQRYKELVRTIGALPLILNYEEHDYATAAISHLPHIIASSLVNLVKTSDTKDGIMKLIAAGGFKDLTRIASSSPIMWQQICLTNGEYITQMLEKFIDSLEEIKDSISSENNTELHDFFHTARTYRDSISNSSRGPIKKLYAIYCDILDETGGIATIAAILANNSLSLKNIGIIHNREFEEGVLRIEFYTEDASTKAVALLRKYRYTVYERK
jgi:prephenate dehydrogenase